MNIRAWIWRKQFSGLSLFLVARLSVTLLLSWIVFQARATTPASPPAIGNFSLPTSQQPGPLYSFGQNIVDQNQLQLFLIPGLLKAPNQHYLGLTPSLLYGLTDNASLLIEPPVALDYKNGANQSSGSLDSTIQGEYAFFNHSTSSYTDQATIVLATTIPTGSARKTPPTGNGSPTYFIGGTYNRTLVEWMMFASSGSLIYSPYHNTRSGTQYYYQAGLGRNLISASHRYQLLALFELDDQYNTRGKIDGQVNPNSGGNILYATPSLWFATEQLILQLGFSIPAVQHWNASQQKVNYYTSATLGWTFR